jgi:acyl carrier protein
LNSTKTPEILHSIAKAYIGFPFSDDAPLPDQVSGADWAPGLISALRQELGVEITPDELQVAKSLLGLSDLVQSKLARDPNGRSLVDIYAAVENWVRQELAHEIDFSWCATWKEDLLKDTDSLDDVEIILRMEDALGFSIPDRDVQAMHTVGQTVRYLWGRSCEQNFTLRQPATDVCTHAFIFYEIRRLLMIRGRVPRKSIQLETQLGQLLPSWYFQFWREIKVAFNVDIPHGNLLTRSLGIEKRTTLRDLVALIVSSKDRA